MQSIDAKYVIVAINCFFCLVFTQSHSSNSFGVKPTIPSNNGFAIDNHTNKLIDIPSTFGTSVPTPRTIFLSTTPFARLNANGCHIDSDCPHDSHCTPQQTCVCNQLFSGRL